MSLILKALRQLDKKGATKPPPGEQSRPKDDVSILGLELADAE